MRIEIRGDSVLLDGYVNAVGRDSRPFTLEGKKIVEQIKPTVFRRAIEKAKNVKLYLNHDELRELGSTEAKNLELYEDNIGLRASCTVTDPEVIEKAKSGELRGWSFGFLCDKESRESMANGMERRFIEEMTLEEVSIIDNRKLPVYIGTLIEQRADDEHKQEIRGEEFRAVTIDNSKFEPMSIDYSKYESKLSAISGK